MEKPPAPPPLPWRRLAVVLRVAVVLLAIFWLVVGAFRASLHWIIVPNLPTWKPDIERIASDWSGLRVEIESLQARLEEGQAVIELRGLSVNDPQGLEHLWVGAFEGQWTAGSLLHLGFSQARVTDWRLRIQRHADQRIFVAGVALQAQDQVGPSAWANWLFKQPALLANRGSIVWQDGQLSGAPGLRLNDVALTITNGVRAHALQLDATPDVPGAEPWSVRMRMKSALLAREAGDWSQWSGQLYWNLPHLNWPWLTARIDTRGTRLERLRDGRGHWRAWVDVRKGQVTGATSDVALEHLDMRLAPSVQALNARKLQGRLVWREQGAMQALEAQKVNITLADGLEWQGAEGSWEHHQAVGEEPESSAFTLRQIDLSTVTQLALRLPQLERWHGDLRAWQPSGMVARLQASWQNTWSSPANAAIEGEVRDLGWRAGNLPPGARAGQLARPGARGLGVTFSTSELEGSAKLRMSEGQLDFPGLWERSAVDVQALRADVAWSQQAGQWRVAATEVQWRNSDVTLQGDASWRAGADGGELDLSLSASEAQLRTLGRYMPLVVPEGTRRYLSAAIQGGRANNVAVQVRGPLSKLPFGSGTEFSVEGDVEGATFEPAPRDLAGAQWLTLKDLSGRYRLDQDDMSLTKVKANWGEGGRIALRQGQARIDAWRTPRSALSVEAKAEGPLSAWLSEMQRGGLQQTVQGALDQVQVNAGDGALALTINMPLSEPQALVVNGELKGRQATVVPAPDWPALSSGRFDVGFGPTGVKLKLHQSAWLGRPLTGQLEVLPDGAWQGQVNGVASLEELAQQWQWPDAWRGLLKGESAFRLLAERSPDSEPWLELSTDLVGVSAAMPAPLNKAAAEAWPLVGRWRVGSDATAWSLTPAAAPPLRLELAPRSEDRKGLLTWGMSMAEVTPRAPWVVALALPSINVDEWRQWLSERDPWPTMGSIDAVPPSVQWFARTADLTVSGWQFRNAMVDALWRGGNWQARVGADEIEGEITLQASSQTQPDGQVTARLSRLRLNPQILQTTNRQQERPKGMPAVDIEVDALRIKDRDWGKVGLLADNTWVRQGDRWVPSWEVKRLSVRLPEAEFKASGSWKPQASQLSAAALGQWRQTDLTWELSLSDAGKLLTRFGMPGVMRGGDGELQGQLSWLGSPLELDQGSLSGSIRMDLGRGQFLKAEPGIAKLLGVLSLQSLPRRLLLDFRDVFQKGFGFDSVSGNAQVQNGVLVTRDLAMRGPSANVLMEGSVSLVNETQNLEVLVVPELDAGTLSLWAGITNPVLGLTTFFAQKVFGDAIADANVRAFKVTGPWQQPEVQAVKLGGQKPAPVRIEEAVSVTDEPPESTEVTPAPPAPVAQ